MTWHEARINDICVTCGGLKWLPLNNRAHQAKERGESPSAHNGDWVECSDCANTGTMLMIQKTYTPPKIIAVDGYRPRSS